WWRDLTGRLVSRSTVCVQRRGRAVQPAALVIQCRWTNPRACGGKTVAITLEAVYEKGTLQLPRTLPLQEHQKVHVTIHILAEEDRVRKTYGLLGWTGDSETVQRVALDAELDPLEGT